MVEKHLTVRTFFRFLQFVRENIKQPSDIPLAIRIGYFIIMIPRNIARKDLPQLLHDFRGLQRPFGGETDAAVERIVRLRRLWLWLPILSSHNTCYVRALTLYRFLDSEKDEMQIHFGVEPGMNPNDRLKGHAWVTVNGRIMEPPEPVLSGRVTRIYSHPPGA